MVRVYLDWNSTAPACPEALAAFTEGVNFFWGNASSLHKEGRVAAERLEHARQILASWTGTRPLEWIFTSGGTESIHAALWGCLEARKNQGRVVSSQGEHSCTLGVLEQMENAGVEVLKVRLGSNGAWDAEEVLDKAVVGKTALVSLIWANNETGVISSVVKVAQELKARKIPLHLDAVQCFGKMEVDLSRLPVAMVSLSAHKFGGPKGVGALFVRQGTPWRRWLQGGNQEKSRRGGTPNVAGLLGMAAAIEANPLENLQNIGSLRDRFEILLLRSVPDIQILGAATERLANTSAFIVPGADSSTLLTRLDELGFAVSSGSACTSGKAEPSHVLLAMGIPEPWAHATLRVSIGPSTTWAELESFVKALVGEAANLRALTPGTH